MLQETKRKGLATELQCQLFFTQLGYNISVPLGEDCRYDFILDVQGKLLRVQVKTCREENNGIVFKVQSTHLSATKGSISHSYTKNDIDVFATFYNNQCYLIPIEDCGVSTKKLLFNKNSIMQSGSYIKDFEALKILNNLIDKNQMENEDEYKKEIQTDKILFKKNNNFYVKQYSMEGEFLNQYLNYAEAARAIGAKKGNTHISEAANGKRKSAYGFLWKVEINKE